MPRQLLRDGQIVSDEWSYFTEVEDHPTGALILSLAQWQSERETWIARGGRLGVVLQPSHKVELIAADIPHFALICLEFAGPSEGRGYSQARILREQLNFSGELRATGYVRQDQLFFMARCGFNSFELPAADLINAKTALATFSGAYQPSNDVGLTTRLQHRRLDTPASA